MSQVKPKKHLGQHFLKDNNIARNIVQALNFHQNYKILFEIGPGTGVLTHYLKELPVKLHLIEIDGESIDYLQKKYDPAHVHLHKADFLSLDIEKITKDDMGIIGNFPYNISSQIFFKILEHTSQIREIVCMLQKEVAQRISSEPGNKNYGILSVLLQAFYDIEYLFDVPPHVFHPPPKVNSGVLRLTRNQVKELPCSKLMFFRIVKQAFQMRRKTLRNALKVLNLPQELSENHLLNQRAEQLTVHDFIFITQSVENQ
ncbi:MAG: 16S rRNA (adenine(1518)-N(6)/adenine(1519)-N(6))-dimethyltransferase RsmA [Cyclobacteriaceae bacterium]